MTTILRLQGLDAKAGTEDIRIFFKLFHIPDGGVYVVGGKLREAFIAFTCERDVQRALRYSGRFLKGSEVALYPSSVEELEQKLKSQLKRRKCSPAQLSEKKPHLSPDGNLQPRNEGSHSSNTQTTSSTPAQTRDPRTAKYPQPPSADTSDLQSSKALAFFLGMCTVLQGLQSSQHGGSDEAQPTADCSTDASNDISTPEQSHDSTPGYVRLFGLPASATKDIICNFFRGLTVQDVIVNVELGLGHGCVVKFASEPEAQEALLFNQQSLGPFCVDVRGATEKMWTMAQQKCENTIDFGERVKPKKSPLREAANHKQKSTQFLMKRKLVNHLPSESLKKPKVDGNTYVYSPTMEYTVMIKKLPKTLTKTEIKELLGCPYIPHQNVLHLLDKEGKKTDTAFVIFNRTEDYEYAMNLTGCHVGSAAIEVSSITKMIMRDMMSKTYPSSFKPHQEKKPNHRISHPVQTPEERTADPAAQTCLFVRNMPADVQKSQLRRLFCNYRPKKEGIILLFDRKGKGIGEAVVQFKSQKLAVMAQKLQGQDFLGSKLLLTPINVKQMEDIVAGNTWK